MAGEETFNFWELIEIMESMHKHEVEELKEILEEKNVEIAELKDEIEKKETSRKEAVERTEFWYRMNETSTRLFKMKMNLEKKSEVSTAKESFLEKGQRKPGRKKQQKMPSQRKQEKKQKYPMNLMPMNPMLRQKSILTNQMRMNTIPGQTNLMINPMTQIINQKMVMNQTMETPMMTMPIFPSVLLQR